MNASHGVTETHLAARVVNGMEVFAQSLANIAPSASLAALPALIALNAGNGVWVSIAIATVLMLLVGTCMSVFARHISTSGSLYTFTARSLGSTAAIITGTCLLIGYSLIAMDCVFGSAVYFGSFFTAIGIDAGGTGPQIVLAAAAAVIAPMLAFRGIRVATRVALIMEVISIIGIAVVMVVVLGKHGVKIDSSQLKFHNFGFNGIILGVVLGVDSFVGFESAASLGVEARDPGRAIPRAIFFSIILVGIGYIISGYTEVLGFHGAKALTSSSAPINDLASLSGVGGMKYLLDIGIGVSFLACIIASINAASRQLYTMGRERVIPEIFDHTSPRHRTPTVAIFSIAPIIGIAPIVMLASGIAPLDGLGYTATLGTFGYLVCYALIGVGAPLYMRKRGTLHTPSLIAGILTVLGIVYIFYKSVYPAPPHPYNLLPYVFAGLVLTSLAGYLVSRRTDPSRASRVGSYEESMTEGDVELTPARDRGDVPSAHP